MLPLEAPSKGQISISYGWVGRPMKLYTNLKGWVENGDVHNTAQGFGRLGRYSLFQNYYL
jgi:hypothetical protein